MDSGASEEVSNDMDTLLRGKYSVKLMSEIYWSLLCQSGGKWAGAGEIRSIPIPGINGGKDDWMQFCASVHAWWKSGYRVAEVQDAHAHLTLVLNRRGGG
jgi:hypothetical protein